jgi:hypothetical protein
MTTRRSSIYGLADPDIAILSHWSLPSPIGVSG